MKCSYLQEFNKSAQSELLYNKEYMSFINTLNDEFDAQIKWNPIAVIMFMDDFLARKVKYLF